MTHDGHVQIAIPSYSRIGSLRGRKALYVHIPDAVAIMKLKLVYENVTITPELYMDVEADNDVEKRMLKRLRGIFKPHAKLAQMARELATASFNLHETLGRRDMHVSTVTLNERRETCQAMLPRLTSIAGHMRAARTEYDQMRVDFKLNRLVFHVGDLRFPEWQEAQGSINIEEIAKDTRGYMARLGGDYEVLEVDASPQPEKRSKTSNAAAAADDRK